MSKTIGDPQDELKRRAEVAAQRMNTAWIVGLILAAISSVALFL